MLYLVYASSYQYHRPDISSFDLIEVETQKELQEEVWEMRNDAFDGEVDYDDSDEEDEDSHHEAYNEAVEDNTSSFVIEYDPTNHQHALLTGEFSQPRPEHAKAVHLEALNNNKYDMDRASTEIAKLERVFSEVKKLLEEKKESLVLSTEKYKKLLAEQPK